MRRLIPWAAVFVAVACQAVNEYDPPDAGPDGGSGRFDGGGFGGFDGGAGGDGAGGAGGEARPPPVPVSPPGCAADAVSITVRPANGAFGRDRGSRGDAWALEHTVTPPDALVTYHCDAGGHYTPTPGGAIYVAGGSVDDRAGLDWPHWEGPVRIVVSGRDAGGCVGTATIDLPLYGDLIAGDSTGSLVVYGSQGAYLGQFAQAADGPIGPVIVLPADADGGGFAVGIKRSGEEGPRVLLLNRDGSERRAMRMIDLQDQPLYPDGAPVHLVYDSARRELLADNAPDGQVYRWTLAGVYAGSWVVPPGAGGRSIGFALVDGLPLAAHTSRKVVYGLDEAMDPVATPGGSFEDLEALGDGQNGTFVAILSGSSNYKLRAFEGTGRERDTAEIGQHAPEYIIPYRDGHLSVGRWTALRFHDSHLQLVDDDAVWMIWRQFGGGDLGGIACLR